MSLADRITGEREAVEPRYRMQLLFATDEGHYRAKRAETSLLFVADGTLLGRDLFNIAPGVQRTVAQVDAKGELRGLIALRAHNLAMQMADLLNDAAGWNGADRMKLAVEKITGGTK